MIKYSKNTLSKAKYIMNTCSSCKRCMRDCVFLRQQRKSPAQLFGNFIQTGSIDPLVPYSCELCHHCTVVCPYKLELADAFLAIRQDLVNQNSPYLPIKQLRGVRFHQIFSNFKLFTYTKKG